REEAPDAVRVHDERSQVLVGTGVRLEVGDVVAGPLPGGLVPPHLPPVGIPGLAGRIARGAVVEHAAVGRPRPGPAGIDAEAGRGLRPPARELRAGFGPGPAVDPVAARGGAVVLEPGETGELLARLDLLAGLRVFEVGQRLAVDLLGDLG